jgi:N-acylglucosamine 2-epimerase
VSSETKPNFTAYAQQYRRALLEDVIPFWERHSPDAEHGGYFTCLNRDGSVFDTDKFVWLQGRQVWTFAMLYHRVEAHPDWLALARGGADFLRVHGLDEHGAWYFALTRQGQPLVQPYSLFSDCFAAMGLAQYGLAAGDEAAVNLARATYGHILERQANPKGRYDKRVPGARPLQGLALPMILSNLVLELAPVLAAAQVEATLDACLSTVLGRLRDPATQLILENVAADGSQVDSFDGRLVNPGHALEATWFLMDIAQRRGDSALLRAAVNASLATLEFGWDPQHGGLFYFMDRLGRPPQQLEWDQKLWWVHLEALVATLMGYALTRRPECWTWFERLHAYTWTHFPDPAYGEWFGYLNRQGEVLLPLKGGKWKGCFHLPRALLRCWQLFETLAAE